MLKLIKNELFKVFHKKSTYIFLIIALLYVVLTNVIYKYFDLNMTQNVSDYFYDINYAEEYINNYNPEVDNLTDYAYYMALLDGYGLSKEYSDDSWQYNIIVEEYIPLSQEYYYQIHSETIDDNYVNELKREMGKIVKALINNDWKYVANNKKEELEKQVNELESIIESNNLSNEELTNYKKEHFIAKEKLELINYRLDENIEYKNDYLNQAITNVENTLYPLAEYVYQQDINQDDYENILKDYYENKYILEHKENTIDEANTRGILKNFFNEYSFLIYVFAIMIAGGIVSDEFNKGTIKSLLITPFSRIKILASKFITAFLAIPIIILAIFIFQMLVGTILFGISSLSIPVVIYNVQIGEILSINIFKYFLIMLVANLPQIILLMTLAFSVSTIFNSTAFAITITFCGIIGAQFINALALSYDIKILDYFVTTNWDFTQFLFGGKSIYDLSLNHSIVICVVYFAIMLITSFIVFNKKDIKNI